MLARCDGEDMLEDLTAHLLDADRAFDDGTAIDVHILGDPLVHGGIRGDLDAGRGFVARDRTASRGEAHDVRAARDLPRHGGGIIAGRVHEDKALGVHALGVAIDLDEVGGAALGCSPERLFEDGGEPTSLVAGGGVVVEGAAVARRVALPPVDPLDQLVGDLRAHRALREQVLRSVYLGRLCEHRCAAMRHEEIRRSAQRRIGGDPGIGVGTAALQRHDEFACGAGLAPGAGCMRQHLANIAAARLHGFPGAADILDVHDLEEGSPLDLIGFEQKIDVIDLAAKPHEQDAGEVRMLGVAPYRALEIAEAVARIGHAAAGAVGQCDDAVHIGIGVKFAGIRHLSGDLPGDRRRTVHGRQDADIVAGSGAAIGAAIALEGGPLGLRDLTCGPRC